MKQDLISTNCKAILECKPSTEDMSKAIIVVDTSNSDFSEDLLINNNPHRETMLFDTCDAKGRQDPDFYTYIDGNKIKVDATHKNIHCKKLLLYCKIKTAEPESPNRTRQTAKTVKPKIVHRTVHKAQHKIRHVEQESLL